MAKVINYIKNENLLNCLPLEIEDIICDFLKEHPAEFKKELKDVLIPWHLTPPPAWDWSSIYATDIMFIKIVRRMKNYDKNKY